MRFILHFALILLVSCDAGSAPPGIDAPRPSAPGSPPRPSLASRVRTWACTYGPADTASLAGFDLVVIESRRWTREEIASLKRRSVVIGYVSFGEADEAEVRELEGVTGWFMDADGDGRPDTNASWNSVFAVPDHPAWRALVAGRIRAAVESKGCDGILLDTLDMVDDYPSASDSMARLVHEMRTVFPSVFFIANRGFAIAPRISGSLDGILFECFTTRIDFARNAYRLHDDEGLFWTHGIWRDAVKPVANRGGLALALDYARPNQRTLVNQAWSRARDYGMIPALSTHELDRVRRYSPAPDRRFLSRYGREALEKRASPSPASD